MGTAARLAALAGLSAGIALSPFIVTAGSSGSWSLVALGAAAGAALAATRPARRGGARGGGAARAWLGLLGLSAALCGLGVGELRLAAIDAGAFTGRSSAHAVVRGLVAGPPHRTPGDVSVRVTTSAGRLLVHAPGPVADLPIGREVVAAGDLRAPRPWESAYLARAGIARVLDASRITLTGRRRGGIGGLVDGIRDRATAALGSGTAPAPAALLRGFVLGQDDRIDTATVNDFRRSGLAHLLAVSGENVALLALLAAPILGLLGVPLRPRIACLLGLIALYVVLTGAGPSIQRAGAMGAAALIATLAGRPRARWYVILLAAASTLLANPRATGDPGWQLSFAAVLGIMLLAAPVRDCLLPADGRAGPLRRALAEGAGVTIAATLATAPLIAVVFGNASLTSLPANLLALPAVAPVMWLGMLDAGLGQIPFAPTGPLSTIAGALAGYVAQVAHWLGSPAWAQVGVSPLSAPAVAGIYLALAGATLGTLSLLRRRRALRPRTGALVAALLLVALLPLALPGSRPAPLFAAPGLRVTVLDVGQGDAILLDPSPGKPVLVDGGPPGDGLAAKLRAAGVSSLGAALVTHDQSDHAGGIEDLLGSFPVTRLGYGVRIARMLRLARADGVQPVRLAEGSVLHSGRMRLELLWPPRELERGAAARRADPNTLALVAVARWRRFSMLLTADAEAESVPTDPGPVDVLKVAHHGSADAGLGALLDRSAPHLAVISVGAGNSYGHPTPATLATLAAHGVPVLRTDLDGNVEIDVTRSRWWVRVPAS